MAIKVTAPFIYFNIYTFLGEVCKKKWKYLRDTYSRKKKQIKGKSGKKGRKVNKWEYFELLKFLEPFVSCNPE